MKKLFKKIRNKIKNFRNDPINPLRHELNVAKSLGLFDPTWYSKRYRGIYSSELDIYKDYIHKSKFSNVNPSPAFDSETYVRIYPDIYYSNMSPMQHYIRHGRHENRVCPPSTVRWVPNEELKIDSVLTKKAKSLKTAVCLHVFYPDFIERFAKGMEHFPVKFDLFLVLSKENMIPTATEIFKKNPNCGNIVTTIAPNRGRNFGPLLVAFGQSFMEYDIVCHLHSKKSLYSGREQTQWSDYLIEYLLRDVAVVTRAINTFAEDETIGTYYPTSFWMMPSWVNHWTRNRPFISKWLKQFGEIDLSDDFINYPVGGMFWARPKALKELFDQQYTYEDFPAEPLPADGSELHALERLIGLLAVRNGYKQLYYHPNEGKFTHDGSYIFAAYKNTSENVFHQIVNHEIISFDLFDTLLRRRHSVADYAKWKLGQELATRGIIESADSFVHLRNKSESELRKETNFKGDITIHQIYERIGEKLKLDDAEIERLLRLEFEIDYLEIEAKQEMVDLFNRLSDHGRKLYIISDTYYDVSHITSFIRKIGITAPYHLLISSEQKMRKDNLTMWHYFKTLTGGKSHVHVGDNVVSDAQLPGDIGITTYHILHPMDKWRALGFPSVSFDSNSLNEYEIKKWGPLVSNNGRSPFIGE